MQLYCFYYDDLKLLCPALYPAVFTAAVQNMEYEFTFESFALYVSSYLLCTDADANDQGVLGQRRITIYSDCSLGTVPNGF